MKISIAMATYNGEAYLQDQLDSFVKQTRQPDELVITDDCSTDQTETIVREFAKTAPFEVQFHRNEKNLGYCGNFNASLTKTTGDLVFLSDQDDVWFREKIEHLQNLAEQHPNALVLMNDAALTDAELNEVGLTKVGQISSAGLPMTSFVMGCCCVARRELLDLCLPIPSGYKSHDKWIASFADGLGEKLVEFRTLQYYRRHDCNKSQGIANRTKRVNRTQAIIYIVCRKFFNKNIRYEENSEIEQLSLFACGVRDAGLRAPPDYKKRLSKLLAATEARQETQLQRMRVRDKWFVPRLLGALKLLKEDGYKKTCGIKAFLRDVLG